MNRLIFLLIFFGLLSSYPVYVQGQAVKLLAGADEAPVNPPDSAYMAGYGQNRKSTGVHDNLYVKAVAVASNDNAVVFVTFDCSWLHKTGTAKDICPSILWNVLRLGEVGSCAVLLHGCIRKIIPFSGVCIFFAGIFIS